MSKWRGIRKNRCPECRIYKEWCYCEHIKKYENHTPITVIMNLKEQKLTSNTVRLATQCLSQVEVILRGVKGKPVDDSFKFKKGFQPLYLFPDHESKELSTTLLQNYGEKFHLIVPDGTWSQVKNIKRRIEAFKDIPSVKIPVGKPSIYSLRTRNDEGALCTFEAIARALQIIEGGTIQKDLEAILAIMIERFQISRGNIKCPAKD